MTMFSTIKRLFAAPVFKDEEKTRAAGLLNTVLLITLAGTILLPLGLAILGPGSPIIRNIALVVGITILGMLILLRRGHVQLAGIILAAALWASFSFAMYSFGGLRDSAVAGLYFVIIMISLVSSGRAVLVFTALDILTVAAIFYAETDGIIVTSMENPPGIDDLITVIITLSLSALLLHATVRAMSRTYDQARRNGQSLQETNVQLEESRAALHARSSELEESSAKLAASSAELERAFQVSQRRQTMLRASAEVSKTITQTHDLDQLLVQVTQLISQNFCFYHVGIFLVDDTGLYAFLRAANSEGGRRMLARGHRLGVGAAGIVGFATGTGQPRIALDVGVDRSFLDNPDLPETRSELAVPLNIGGQTIGALDIQSTDLNAFDEEDMTVFATLADQISTAIENVNLLQKTQAALEQAEIAQRRYLRKEWDAFLGQRSAPSSGITAPGPTLEGKEALS